MWQWPGLLKRNVTKYMLSYFLLAVCRGLPYCQEEQGTFWLRITQVGRLLIAANTLLLLSSKSIH